MPRIAEDRRTGRKTAILDAAERCFVRSGFHGASMAEICVEADMSPGNLYRYFPSKEAMIEGLCERDFAEIGEGFAALSHAPDIWTAFEVLACDRGQTVANADLERAVKFLIAVDDGLMLRRARDPAFDPRPHVALMFDLLRDMPLPPATPCAAKASTP